MAKGTLIPLLIMIVLAGFVLQTAARIELWNTRAGNYLPRKDRNPDGTFADGKWRMSVEQTPRNELRNWVQTFGLLQYILAPLLLILAMIVIVKSRESWAKSAGGLGVFVAVIAISLMLHREYYQSLGW